MSAGYSGERCFGVCGFGVMEGKKESKAGFHTICLQLKEGRGTQSPGFLLSCPSL